MDPSSGFNCRGLILPLSSAMTLLLQHHMSAAMSPQSPDGSGRTFLKPLEQNHNRKSKILELGWHLFFSHLNLKLVKSEYMCKTELSSHLFNKINSFKSVGCSFNPLTTLKNVWDSWEFQFNSHYRQYPKCPDVRPSDVVSYHFRCTVHACMPAWYTYYASAIYVSKKNLDSSHVSCYWMPWIFLQVHNWLRRNT